MQSYDGFQHVPSFPRLFARSCRDTWGYFVTTSLMLDTVVASYTLSMRKTVFKKYPSPSPVMGKLPVNKGSRAFPAGAKGMQNLHLSFTRHARRGIGPSPVMRG